MPFPGPSLTLAHWAGFAVRTRSMRAQSRHVANAASQPLEEVDAGVLEDELALEDFL